MVPLCQDPVSIVAQSSIQRVLAWIDLTIKMVITYIMLFLVAIPVIVLAATGGHQKNSRSLLPQWQSIGELQITSYRPIAAQTKPACTSRDHCRTSTDDGITKYGAAISQDLLANGTVHYGDILLVDGIDRFVIINDCMGVRAHHAVDLLVFTRDEEKAIGVKHLRVWVMAKPENENH